MNHLERYIQQYLTTGERPEPASIAPPEELAALTEAVKRYHRIDDLLEAPPDPVLQTEPLPSPTLPPGFRLIEEIGSGGSGRVFKAHDESLNRTVAVKVLHALDESGAAAIMREARMLASLDDPAVTAVYGVFPEHAAVVTAFVDGFDLMETAPSLSPAQKLQIMDDLLRALSAAHNVGLLHRDIKPAQIKLDRNLRPHLLDFGLAQYAGEPDHGRGTPDYAAPEQFETHGVIDRRTDLFALGAVFYELWSGRAAFSRGSNQPEHFQAPPLPRELDSTVPEPLQAAIMTCLEPAPGDRYADLQALAADLERYRRGLPVKAQPRYLTATLETRVQSHLDALEHWREAGLVYADEAADLQQAYTRLTKSQEDWIPENRRLTWHQIVLYLGVLVLAFGAGGLFYAKHFMDFPPESPVYPVTVLALVFAGTAVGGRLTRKPVAVAFDLAGILVLPMLTLSLLTDLGLFAASGPEEWQLFTDQGFTNPRLQIGFLVVTLWALYRAERTQTVALSTTAALSMVCLSLCLSLSLGLRPMVEEGAWHVVARHLLPPLVFCALLGALAERDGRRYLAKPAYVLAALWIVLIPELLSLNGKALSYLNLSSTMPADAPEGYDPLFFDTVLAMVLTGILIYWVARKARDLPSKLVQQPAGWLTQISPFLILEPLGLLVAKDLYGVFYHWFYLALSLGILLISGRLQRRGFYYAGLFNSAAALYYLTGHYQWLETRWWPILLIGAGSGLLMVGRSLFRRSKIT
ncbi:MAG: serine/threonine-protein kinase [Acidobacteriota bacterium]|nr:serine/threonine-protein kinase [Acidobacteriota bacterium]